MSLSLEFVVGDSDEIIRAVKDEDFDQISKLEENGQVADFNLHIIPNDLNFLVYSACELRGLHEKMGLRENCDFDNNFFDSEDRGACNVLKSIPELFSQFQISDSKILTELWFSKLKLIYPKEEIQVSDNAIHSVRRLIEISKMAVNTNLDLVHIWFL